MLMHLDTDVSNGKECQIRDQRMRKHRGRRTPREQPKMSFPEIVFLGTSKPNHYQNHALIFLLQETRLEISKIRKIVIRVDPNITQVWLRPPSSPKGKFTPNDFLNFLKERYPYRWKVMGSEPLPASQDFDPFKDSLVGPINTIHTSIQCQGLRNQQFQVHTDKIPVLH